MYTASRSHRGAIAPIAGERTGVRLVNGAVSHFVTLVARATLTITTPVTAIRNRGSIWAAFDEVGIDENGTDRHLYDGKVLRFLSEMSAPSALSAARVTAVGAGTYQLEEAVRIYFAHPLSLDPSETAFVERDPRQILTAFVRLNANAINRLVDLTAGAATLTGITVNVIQGYEGPQAGGRVAPLFLPTARQQIAPVAGVNTTLTEFLRTTNPIRGLVVSQETTTVGEVSDILNRITLRGDYTNIIGPSSTRYADELLQSEFEFGGSVISSNRAHLGFNFQQYGKLSKVLNPAQDANMRFEFDAQPSASAGASQLRITVLELQRDPQVVNPQLPFSV